MNGPICDWIGIIDFLAILKFWTKYIFYKIQYAKGDFILQTSFRVWRKPLNSQWPPTTPPLPSSQNDLFAFPFWVFCVIRATNENISLYKYLSYSYFTSIFNNFFMGKGGYPRSSFPLLFKSIHFTSKPVILFILMIASEMSLDLIRVYINSSQYDSNDFKIKPINLFSLPSNKK